MILSAGVLKILMTMAPVVYAGVMVASEISSRRKLKADLEKFHAFWEEFSKKNN